MKRLHEQMAMQGMVMPGMQTMASALHGMRTVESFQVDNPMASKMVCHCENGAAFGGGTLPTMMKTRRAMANDMQTGMSFDANNPGSELVRDGAMRAALNTMGTPAHLA